MGEVCKRMGTIFLMHAKQSVHRAGPGQIRRSDPMLCMFLESAQHEELFGSGFSKDLGQFLPMHTMHGEQSVHGA